MTEGDWLTCSDPIAMLRYLTPRGSTRKLRLFACACCRRIWPLLTDRRARQAVDLGEALADGRVRPEECLDAVRGGRGPFLYTIQGAIRQGVRLVALEASFLCAARAYGLVSRLVQDPHDLDTRQDVSDLGLSPTALSDPRAAQEEVSRREQAGQVALLHDIFGNPFRRVAFDPEWSTWERERVRHLAQSIYNDRQFKELPVLADALEEAGCENDAILGHCRSEAPHAPGCWVVDALLGWD